MLALLRSFFEQSHSNCIADQYKQFGQRQGWRKERQSYSTVGTARYRAAFSIALA